MKQVLTKAFVKPFYKAFMGFFLLLMLIFGVFIKAEVHIMLGYQIVQTSFALGGIIIVFILYAAMHWHFQRKLVTQAPYKVFHQLGLMKAQVFFKDQLYIWLSNHIILILYNAFLSTLCMELQLWGTLIILWLVLAVLYGVYAGLIFHQLRKPLQEVKIKKSTIGKTKRYKIPYDFWLLIHLKNNRPLLLLASKFVCLFLLNLFFSAYQNGGYDNRWLHFAILCASFLNLPLLIEKRDFENSSLTYFLNMPTTFVKKVKSHLVQILWLILPELIFIIYQTLTSEILPFAFSFVLLTIAMHLGLYALFNYISDASKQGKYSFAAFFILFFSILYALPVWALAIPSVFLLLISIKSDYKI